MKKDYNRNPKGSNQWILRSNEEIQKIIDKHPTWTKKDFRGEGKLNPKKENALLTRKETDRTGLKFYQVGKRVNLKDVFKHSTQKSIEEFKAKKINLETLRNRASTKKIRDNMTESQKKMYDKKIYENLTEEQLENKRERQKKFRERMSKNNK